MSIFQHLTIQPKEVLNRILEHFTIEFFFSEINFLCAPNLIFLLIFAENIHLLPLRCKIKKDLLLLFIVAH